MKVRNFLAAVLIGIGMMFMSTGAAQAGSYVDDVKLATQDPNVILTVYMGMSAQDLEANFAGAKDWKLAEKRKSHRFTWSSERIPFTTYIFVKGNVGKDTVCETLQVDVEDGAGVVLAEIGFFTNYRSAAADIKERIYQALVSYHGKSSWRDSQYSSAVSWLLNDKDISMYVHDRNKFRVALKGRIDERSEKQNKNNPATQYTYWVKYGLQSKK